ncbi:MAG: MFS transporter [Sphingomicrobium sp.]
MSDPSTVRNENGKGIALLAAQVLPVMAIVSLFPAIPKLFQQFGGIRHAELLVPMILTVPSLMVALTAPLAGAVADRFGRRPTFLAGLILYVAMGLVPIFVADIGIIVVSRAILGIAEAIAVTVSSALIGDYFGEQRQKWTSWVGIVISVVGTAMLVAGGKLLRRAKGATIVEMQEVTGWQPHSIRAFLSGLRKKGAAVSREQRKSGETTYRLASKAAAAVVADA